MDISETKKMKFRIKFHKQSIVVSIPEASEQGACLRDLKQGIRQQLPVPITQFEVSLNGREPLLGETTTLKELGLVSGDRLHIIEGESSKGTATVTNQTVSGEDKLQASSKQSGHSPSTSATPLKPAKELHNSTDTKRSTDTTGTSSDLQDEVSDPGVTADYKEQAMDTEVVRDAEVNRYLAEPMLVRESTTEAVPEVLQDLYSNTEMGGSKHQAVLVVLHLLMVETGFQLQEKPESGGFPADWRQNGLYRLQYTVPSDTGISVVLMYVELADVGKVHCSVKGSDVKYSCTVNPSDFVTKLSQDACSTYRNLHRLSQTFKDKVSYPVLQSIHRDGVPSLLNITSEVQLMILTYLRPQDLLRMTRVCKQYLELCSEPVLWRKLYLKKFGKRHESNNLNQDWKMFYKEKYAERERMRRQFVLMTQPPPAMPRIPFHPGPDPLGPVFPPGAIGGDFDRDPYFPGVPDVFGSGRGGTVPHTFPRPRFDPIGPLPEQNIWPGRGGGLWEAGNPSHVMNRGGGRLGSFGPRFM